MNQEKRGGIAGWLNKANEITCSAFLSAFLFLHLGNKASFDTEEKGGREGGEGGCQSHPNGPRSLIHAPNVMFPLTETEKNSDLMIPETIHTNNPGR